METDDYRLWMSGGTLLLVAAQVPHAQHQAVLDSLLYAQLVANKAQGSRFANYSPWYSRYRRGLSERGWIMTQLFRERQCTDAASVLVPIQPLSLWLQTQHEAAGSLIERGLNGLAGNDDALQNLRRYTFEGDEHGTRIALEIGLVHPGPVITLCSLGLQTDEPLAQAAIERPLPARTLQGDVAVNGLSAQLDSELFEPRREELRALVARKQQEQCYLLDLGAVPGAEYE
ncbi:hypothetical protein M2D63_014190 [Pseudomonas sp. BJa5]|uniref:hypothetical protein n=1 Tax=Pseudomonas sp. BJa5 TaxID=2936270 RepID=UPI0025594D91|nr:hypothetical protein [Pseudomonas sp. BGr12]MDL2422268.1 hypothetical protein [Pseudomonas sp. BGr12]